MVALHLYYRRINLIVKWLFVAGRYFSYRTDKTKIRFQKGAERSVPAGVPRPNPGFYSLIYTEAFHFFYEGGPVDAEYLGCFALNTLGLAKGLDDKGLFKF
jgi:hypothetical protein